MFPRVFGCLLIVLLAGDFASAQKTTPPPKPAAGPAPIVLPSNNQDSVQMQFPNSDVKDILSLYERLTHKKVVFDNSVQGPVNIVINQMVPREEAIKIIEINLLLNGFSIVPEDENIVKVTGVGKNPRSAGVPVYSDAELLPEGDRVVTFVFNLKYADPTELQTMLAPYITTGGSQYTSIVALPKAQALLITENTAVIRTLIKIVQSVDVPPAEVVSEFIPLERADAKDVLEKLEKIFEKTQTGGSGIPRPAVMPAAIPGQPAVAQAGGSVEINAGGPSEESLIAGKIKLTADVRTNRIHVVTRPVNLPFVRKLVKEFDDDIAFAEPKIRNLKFILAGDVLPVVVKAITEPGVKPDDSGANGQNAQNGQRTATGATTTGATGAGGGGIGGAAGRTTGGGSGGAVSISEALQTPPIDTTPLATTVGNTKIIADRRANTIIVLGNEAVTQKVFKVLDQMDVRAPQVMLNTVIGELQLTNEIDTGIDLLAFLNQAGGSTASSGSSGVIGTTASTIQNGFLSTHGLNLGASAITGASGISNPLSQFAVATNTLQGTVHALESTGKFRVTQRPTVFTSNNKKAVIASGEEIGIPSTTLTSLNTITNGNAAVASSVQYQQVLLQLEVVPLINSDREVSLDILQQIDDLSGQTDTIGGNAIPRINTRYIRTNVLVANGKTVVLGGLIKKSSQRSSGGPPWIGNIPILGQLFRRNQNVGERDELIILIRPVVTITPKEDLANSEREQEHLMIPPDLESTLDPEGTTVRVGKPVVHPVTPQPMLRSGK